MAQWLTLERAAQLLRVPRSALQRRVRAGELKLRDGRVSTAALLRLYPLADFDRSGWLHRLQRDGDPTARGAAAGLPGEPLLAQRLFSLGQELADTQRHLQRYHALVLELRERLACIGADSPDPRLPELQRQLIDGLARALATEPVDLLDVMDDVLKVVSAQVTLRPSGHQFSVDGHDTLLQAGIRAGLKLNYGCGNGSCGMCKVRVTAGQVARTGPADYPLSAAERAQGYVLACAHTAASAELTIEVLEAAGPADIPPQQLTTTLRALQPLAADTLALHLQTPRSQRLRFLAGQRVALGLADDDAVQACYPIASCPCDDRNLHFYVPRDPADPLAERLFAGALRPGAALTLRGPEGSFVLADDTRPLVFAACDTGFAPVNSLIEHALSRDAAPSIALYWLATRADGHFRANQTRAWSDCCDQFEASLSRHADAAQGAHEMAAAIRAEQFDIDCAFYVAGPGAFVGALQRELLDAGVPAAQLHAEVTSR